MQTTFVNLSQSKINDLDSRNIISNQNLEEKVFQTSKEWLKNVVWNLKGKNY